jgi:1-acyl-sn-glycerol-3-phosphate acyltransferase
MSTALPASPRQGRAAAGLGPRLWSRFCRTLVRVFYRRVEVSGTEHLPSRGGVLLCANHASALADAVILQAACPIPFHPLARSGLFENPLLRPVLAILQAVPIYRRQDSGSETAKNEDSFSRCFEILAQGEALLIFPEGQSHSDPSLRQLKTGAARLALGALQRNGVAPTVIPVGITFTRKGRFRSRVLIQFGPAVPMPAALPASGPLVEADVRAATAAIDTGLRGVTLNLDSWEDFEFLVALRRFFAFRRGRRELRGSLAHRLRALQRLSEAQRVLRRRAPARVAALTRKLRRFQRLCRRFGVRDYHLKVRYSGWVVTQFLARSLFFAVIVFPLAIWGILHSALPFFLTRHLARRLARGSDQYDTTKMLLGMFFFGLFWTAQAYVAWRLLGFRAATWYAASLPLTAATALAVGRERMRIMDNVRAFLLFARNRDLRPYMLAKREEIEADLARLARLAKQPEVRDEAERENLAEAS